MHAGFGFQVAVGIGAGDFDGNALDAGFFAVLQIENIRAETAAFDPAQVHARQHLRPILRSGAAGAGMDGEDGAFRVFRVAEHAAEFQIRDPFVQFIQVLLQLAGHAVIVLFVGQEQEISDIVLLFAQFVPGIHPLPGSSVISRITFCAASLLFQKLARWVLASRSAIGLSILYRCQRRPPERLQPLQVLFVAGF